MPKKSKREKREQDWVEDDDKNREADVWTAKLASLSQEIRLTCAVCGKRGFDHPIQAKKHLARHLKAADVKLAQRRFKSS